MVCFRTHFLEVGILQHVREVMNLFAIRTRLQGKTLPWSIQQVRNYKKTIEKLHKEKPALLQGSNVLVRVDFNVPFKNKDGKNISDDTRIREALPTIKFLSNAGAKVLLASHCGRPKGQVNEKMRMAPMAQRLSELLDGKPVGTVKDCIGPEVEKAVQSMSGGDILMLENARFHSEEEKNESSFAKKLVADTNANVYVNDAFGTAHRAHATTAGVSPFVDHRVAGYLLGTWPAWPACWQRFPHYFHSFLTMLTLTLSPFSCFCCCFCLILPKPYQTRHTHIDSLPSMPTTSTIPLYYPH